MKKESQSSVDLEEGEAAAGDAPEAEVEEAALAKHRAREAIVIGEVVEALGTSRSMDLPNSLLHDLIEMAWLLRCRGAAFARQVGRAAVDMEAFEQHRTRAVWGLLDAAGLGRRRAKVLKDADIVEICNRSLGCSKALIEGSSEAIEAIEVRVEEGSSCQHP